ncbi:MAG: membrane-bound lytic murein transglycosylase MltF [Rhodocyclaceae bacterium]|uniref:membrane-bound lytic murein transglycosylase MltF n=1 Tax=Sulfuricystis thermophila TaxID=2496847 RepID=UPI0015589EB2|nr:membrane-bound lytic murein transglycosylase MltF [Sulfuricystis thermophila]MDI6750004.1 membrane-bound lytic murein transglycosylase MltF [Rhodocyclaceae bacterium]
MREKSLIACLRRLAVTLIFGALLAGCDFVAPLAPLKPPGPRQPLVVALSADPAFAQPAIDSEGLNGFSRDLAERFAQYLGVKVRFVPPPAQGHAAEMVVQQRAHMIATVPIQTKDASLLYSPLLFETPQVIVQHANALPLENAEKLAGREIHLLPGAPQAQTLAALGIEPPPRLVEHRGTNELALIAGIADLRHELVASDELHFDLATNISPDLAIALKLPDRLGYGWAIAPAYPELREKATEFIAAIRQDGTLRRLYDRYFGHIKRLDNQDVAAFLDAAQTRLPALRPFFAEAERITGFDWRLLAALAWQESKWEPLATSPTGVRGIMMLTEETADRLGVKNRLDPRESILAGARYLAMLMDELPDEILPPERLWFALAAYNLGMGHLKGGRHFAPGLKKSPNHWADMKDVLPLLSRPEYYTRLKSGRARGGETVIMVENVRNYYDILVRIEPRRSLSPLQSGLTMQ